MKQYGISKACNIIYSAEYNRRYSSKGVYSVSLHPGGIKTGLQKYNTYLDLFKYVPDIYCKTISQGAATTIRVAAINDTEFIKNGGKYFEDSNVASLWRSNQDLTDDKELGSLLYSVNEKFIKKGRMSEN